MTVVYAVGDAATGNSDSQELADLVRNSGHDAFLYLGDVYESGTAGEFAANYKPSWGALDATCYPIQGNHDAPNYSKGYKPYFDAVGRPSMPYYGFKLNDWTFFMCSSEQPMDPTSAQYQWLAAKLQANASPGRKNIACWHRPRYCSGSHGDAVDTDPLWQLVNKQCALVLSGHAHNAQVLKADTSGCLQVVSGAGGRGLYAEIPGDSRLVWGEASGYAVAELRLADDLGLSFLAEDGTEMWSMTLKANLLATEEPDGSDKEGQALESQGQESTPVQGQERQGQ